MRSRKNSFEHRGLFQGRHLEFYRFTLVHGCFIHTQRFHETDGWCRIGCMWNNHLLLLNLVEDHEVGLGGRTGSSNSSLGGNRPLFLHKSALWTYFSTTSWLTDTVQTLSFCGGLRTCSSIFQASPSEDHGLIRSLSQCLFNTYLHTRGASIILCAYNNSSSPTHCRELVTSSYVYSNTSPVSNLLIKALIALVHVVSNSLVRLPGEIWSFYI